MQKASVTAAENFIARDKLATGYASDRKYPVHHSHRWWHLTVLAVARITSAIDGLTSAPRRGWHTENSIRDARLALDSVEAAVAAKPADFDQAGSNVDQAIPSYTWDLAGAARDRVLMAIRVNLSAAEKIRANLDRSSDRLKNDGLVRAIECMTGAIQLDPSIPENYVERGGLLARIGATGADRIDYVRRAAADFATALRLDGDVRRYQSGVAVRSVSRVETCKTNQDY